ncbi:MAG TPA: GAF domain-containing protein [Anaerolineales bacterium]|nr:GAF domain-containing protein [Anaerolineales bacterium]
MNWSYALALLLSTAGAIAISLVAWYRHPAPGAIALTWLGAAMAVWMAAYACHFLTTSASSQLFWLKMTYLGVLAVPTIFLLFAIRYSNRDEWLRNRATSFLLIEPLLTMIFLWTDPKFHLFFGNQVQGEVILGGGFGFWLNAVYSYALILFAFILLLNAYQRTPRPLRGQTGAILVGGALPFAVNLLGLVGWRPFPGLDLTPFAFTVTCLCFMIGLSYYHLLDIVPIARDALVESMPDGVMVLDKQNRIVDINRTALRMVGRYGERVIGLPAEELLSPFKDIFERFRDTLTTHQEIRVGSTSPTYLDLNISPLYDRRGRFSGRLVVARDITKRYLTERAEHEQRLLAEALRDTAAILNNSRSFDEVLDHIFDNVGRVIPFDLATFMLLDDHGVVHSVRSRGYQENGLGEAEKSLSLRVDEIPNFHIMIESGRALVVPDTLASEHWIMISGMERLRSYVGAPVKVKGVVVGFLDLASLTSNHFTQAHADQLQAFADQSASAIENARLFEETQQRAEQMAALFEIGLTLTSGLEMDQVLRVLLEECKKILPVEAFYVAVLDPKTDTILHPLFYDLGKFRQVPPRNLYKDPGLSGYIIRKRRTLYLPDTLARGIEKKYPIMRAGGQPTRSYVGVPLIIGERVVGGISMQSYQPDAYTPEQIRILETIATQAAVAIDNARLFEEIQRRAEQMTALFDIGLVATSGMDMDRILKGLLEKCKQVLPVEAFYIAVFDPDTGLIDHPLFYDMGEFFDLPSRDIRHNPGLSGYIIQSGQTLYLPDISDPIIEKKYKIVQSGGNPTRSFVGVPLTAGEKVVGVISMQSSRPEAYTPEQVRLLETIATQAAGVIENIRLYNKSQEELAQRKRMERSLRQVNKRLQAQLAEIEALQAQLREQAIRDALTGLFNRRYLEETLEREYQRARREGGSLCLIMLDIDGFKAFNDEYGHDAGDLLLSRLGDFLRSEFRASDISCRYGGEEFLIVLPSTTLEKGLERAEHFRLGFSRLDIQHDGTKLEATMSLGVAAYPRHGETWQTVLKNADRALYAAKNAGKNCTRAAE